MTTFVKAYRFRMRPTKTQEQAMFRQAGACRYIWNWGLERRKAYYAEHKKTLTFFMQCKELTALKRQPGMEWLNDVANTPLKQSLRDLDRAFVNFFARRTRFPQFKSAKRELPRFRCMERISVKDGTVSITKMDRVRIQQHRSIGGTTKSASFKRNACGHWHVTLVV